MFQFPIYFISGKCQAVLISYCSPIPLSPIRYACFRLMSFIFMKDFQFLNGRMCLFNSQMSRYRNKY